MPEAPDLQVIMEYLQPRIVGRRIANATERKPLVLLNLTAAQFAEDITGRAVTGVRRKGKLLLIGLNGGRTLVVSPMLTGGLQHCTPATRVMASTILLFDLEDGMQLRYFDQRRMGQVYYAPEEELAGIVRLEAQGPDVLDVRLTPEEFRERLKPFRGEIKGVLTRGKFISGIGNAYADEILFEAKIYPFTKRGRLDETQLERLRLAVYETPSRAVKVLRGRVGADIHKKVRDFLKVHGKGGAPCPECGNPITSITTNRRETNYCRRCQPGSLFAR